MHRHLLFSFVVAVFTLCSGVGSSFAEEMDRLQTYEISPGLQLKMVIPGNHWTVSKTAPQYLVDEAVEDVEEDLKTQGKTATPEQIKAFAEKRLSSNELYVFNPASKAVLEISFSPLGQGEEAPSRKTVKASADAAGESMNSEGGVTGSKYLVKKAQIPGAETVYRLEIGFEMDGSPRKFIGLIGFAKGNWVFFYYTDRLGNPTDYSEMEGLLESLVIQSAAAPKEEGT